MLRIVGGRARGCRLELPRRGSVRPPSDRLRESLFAALEGDLAGAEVLDLFAGSGTFGLEALSRGAEFCTFLEKDRKAVEVLKRNIRVVGLPWKCKVVQGHAKEALNLPLQASVAFLDPPFDFFSQQKSFSFLRDFLGELSKRVMKPGGLIVLRYEKAKEGKARELVSGLNFEVPLARNYGRSSVKLLVAGESSCG